MSEKLQVSGEQAAPNLDVSREAQENLKRLEQAAKAAEQDPIQKHVESLQARVETQAISGKEFPKAEVASEQSAQIFGITQELKTDAYNRTLKRIRTHMSTPDRIMSKVVHQPIIEKVSNVSARTVARPSAFLGGSFLALIASTALVYLSRHYGFTYNYAIIFIAFAAGFILAIAIELLFKLVKRRRTF
jgi:hypothetical protein